MFTLGGGDGGGGGGGCDLGNYPRLMRVKSGGDAQTRRRFRVHRRDL